MVTRPNVFVMRMCHNFRMMRRIVVAKHTLSLAHIGVSIVDVDRITQLGADSLMDIKVRFVPEEDSTAQYPVIVIGRETDDRLAQRAFEFCLRPRSSDAKYSEIIMSKEVLLS